MLTSRRKSSGPDHPCFRESWHLAEVVEEVDAAYTHAPVIVHPLRADSRVSRAQPFRCHGSSCGANISCVSICNCHKEQRMQRLPMA